MLPGVAILCVLVQRPNEFDTSLNKLLTCLTDVLNEEATDDRIRREMLVGSLRTKDLYFILVWKLKNSEILRVMDLS